MAKVRPVGQINATTFQFQVEEKPGVWARTIVGDLQNPASVEPVVELERFTNARKPVLMRLEMMNLNEIVGVDFTTASKIITVKDKPKRVRDDQGPTATTIEDRQVIEFTLDGGNGSSIDIWGVEPEDHFGLTDQQPATEIEVVLTARPATNEFKWRVVGADMLDWQYQPELTQEEIDEGSIRQVNAIHSYAIYHQSPSDTLAATSPANLRQAGGGKAFHVYRPAVFDAAGDDTWGELNYADGVMSVTVDGDWLDNATYPVTIDPTFGNEEIGASTTQPYSGDALFVVGYPMPEPGQITSLYHYAQSSNAGNVYHAAVYSDDGGGYPGNLEGSEGTPVGYTSTYSWNPLPYADGPSVNGGTMWIGWLIDYLGGFTLIRYDAGSTNQFVEARGETLPLPATFPPLSGNVIGRTWAASIYGEYIAGAPGAPKVQPVRFIN